MFYKLPTRFTNSKKISATQLPVRYIPRPQAGHLEVMDNRQHSILQSRFASKIKKI